MKRILILFLIFIFAIPVYSAKITIGKNLEILVDGKPFFPIMVWAQPIERNGKDLVEFNKSLGINTFVGHKADTRSPKEYLDECAKRNVFACISAGYDIKEDEQMVSNLKDHPALLFWWFPDEPDNYSPKTKKLPKYSPDELLPSYQLIKKKDPNHPVALNFGSGLATGTPPIPISKYKGYMKCCDILSCTSGYPENKPDKVKKLHFIAKGLEKLAKFDETKPRSTWIGVSYIGAEGGRKPDPEERAPKPEEVKAEVWMAIVSGATMIAYFPHSWSPSYEPNRIPNDVQEEMKKVNRQITELTPVICGPNSKIEVTATVKEDSMADIHTLVKEGNEKLYIFASNFKDKEGEVEFSVKGFGNCEVTVYEEGRKIVMTNGKFADKFKIYEPHIYVIDKK